VFADTREKTLFAEAEARFLSGEYTAALELYDRFLRDFPYSTYMADTQFRKAVSLYRTGQSDRAYELFTRIEERYSSTRFIGFVPFWIGVIRYERGEYAEAFLSMEEFLGGEETSLRREALLYKALCERELDEGDPVATLELLLEEYESSLENIHALSLLCSALLTEKQYRRVLEILQDIDLQDIGTQWRPRFSLYLAEAYWFSEMYDRAEAIYEQLLTASSDIAAVAFSRLFVLYRTEGDQIRMQNVLIRAEEVLAGKPEILAGFWLRIGIESYKNEKTDLALSYFSRIWNRGDRSTMEGAVPLYLSQIEVERGNRDRAVEVLRSFLAVSDNRRAEVTFRLAGLEVESGEWDAAVDRLSKFLEDYPRSNYASEAAYLLAYSRYKRREYDEALDLCRRMLAQAQAGAFLPNFLRLQSVLFRKLGEDSAAIRVLREYIPLRPDAIGARVDLMKLLFSRGDYRTVLKEIEDLTRVIPDVSGAYPEYAAMVEYMRGLSHIAFKEYESALEALSMVTATDAFDLSVIEPFAVFYRGWASYRLAYYTEALAEFRHLMEYFPEHELVPRSYYLAGWCAYSLRDFKAAERYFGTYANLREGSSNRMGTMMFGKSLLGQGKLDEAAALFREFASAYPNSTLADDALFEYAGIQVNLDNPETASHSFLNLADRYPDSPLAEEALYRRGELLYEAGRYSDARDAFYEHRSRYPNGTLYDASLYWGGMAAAEAGEGYGALLLWEKIINQYRASSFRSDALRRSAEVYSEGGDLRMSLRMYSELIASYPEEAEAADAEAKAEKISYQLLGQSDTEAELSVIIGREGAESPKGRDAMLELARFYLYNQSDKMNQALTLLERVVEKKEVDPERAARANYYLGEYYFKQNDPVKAGNQFLLAASMYTEDKDLMAMSLFRAVEMALAAGKPADARAIQQRIEENFPNSEWAVRGAQLLEGVRR